LFKVADTTPTARRQRRRTVKRECCSVDILLDFLSLSGFKACFSPKEDIVG
jgi:hypothetical protein